jgi:hypothetical protein
MNEGRSFISLLRSSNRRSQTEALNDLLDQQTVPEQEKEQLLRVIVRLYLQERDNDKVRIQLLEKNLFSLIVKAEKVAVECVARVDPQGEAALRGLSICRITLASLVKNQQTDEASQSAIDIDSFNACFATLTALCQSSLCNKTVRNVTKFVDWTRKEFSNVLQSSSVQQRFCEYLNQNMANGLCGAVIFMPMLRGKEGESEKLASVRALVLEQLLKRIQGVSKAQPELSNPLWGIFTQNLDQSQWDGPDGVEAQIIKSFKKSPESFCAHAINLVRNLNPAVSMHGFCTQGGIGLCVRVMKSEDLSIRHGACELLVKALRCVTDRDIFLNSISQLVDSLHGKFPGIATVSIPLDHHKVAILLCLNCLCNDIRIAEGESSPQRDYILQQLKAFWLKEKDVGLASLIATVLAAIMKYMLNQNTTVISPATTTFIENLKSDFEKAPAVPSNVTRISTLIFLVELMLGLDKSNVRVLFCFTPSLVNMMKESLKKPAWSNDLTFALALLFEWSTVDKDLMESLKTLKITNAASNSAFGMFGETYRSIFDNVLGCTNLSMAITNIDQYPSSLAAVQSSINLRAGCISCIKFFANFEAIDREGYTKLLATSAEKVISIKDTNEFLREHLNPKKLNAAYELLVQVTLLVSRFDLWEMARSSLSVRLQQHPMLSIHWLFTSWSKLNSLSSQHEAAVELERMTIAKQSTAEGAAITSTTVKALPNISSDVKAIVALAMTAMDSNVLSESQTILLLFIAVITIGHPMVSGNITSSIRWVKAHLNKANIKDDSQICEILATHVFQVSRSSNISSRVAAHRAVRLLCEVLPTSEFNAFPILNAPSTTLHFLKQYATQILQSLNHDTIFNLTEEDKKIFYFPDLVIEEAMNEIRQKIQSEASEITNADRKKAAPRSSRKGTFGSDVVEDEEWAEKVRKEKAAKMMQATESTELEAIKQRVYGKKNALQQIIEAVKYSFEAIKNTSLLSEEQCRYVMTEIISSKWVWQYFGVELVDDFARSCLQFPLQHILENALKPLAWLGFTVVN